MHSFARRKDGAWTGFYTIPHLYAHIPTPHVRVLELTPLLGRATEGEACNNKENVTRFCLCSTLRRCGDGTPPNTSDKLPTHLRLVASTARPVYQTVELQSRSASAAVTATGLCSRDKWCARARYVRARDRTAERGEGGTEPSRARCTESGGAAASLCQDPQNS